MISLKELALALAVTVALASLGQADDSIQKLSDDAIISNLDAVDSSTVSRWRYEVSDWPQASQCGGFWLRLDAAIACKSLTLKEFDDKEKAAKIVGPAEAQVLHKLSARLRARKSSKLLTDFLDSCIKQVSEGRLEIDEAASSAAGPISADAPSSEQSGDLARLQAELAEAREQLKLERTTNEQLLTNNKQLKLELETTKEDCAREKSVLASTSTIGSEHKSLQAELGEQVKVALAKNEQLWNSNQQLKQSKAQVADQLQEAQRRIQDLHLSYSYAEQNLKKELKQANKELEKMQFTLAANKSELKNCREDTKLSKDAKSIIKDLRERSEDLSKAFKHSAEKLTKSEKETKKCEKKLTEMMDSYKAVLTVNMELETRLRSTQNSGWQNNYAVSYY